MRKIAIAILVLVFLFTLGQRLPRRNDNLHVLAVVQIGDGANSTQLHAQLETKLLKRDWRYEEMICGVNFDAHRYSLYFSRIRPNDYLLHLYQSPIPGGPITAGFTTSIQSPISRHEVIDASAEYPHQGYRLNVYYSPDKKSIDSLREAYVSDGSFSCKLRDR